MATLDPNAWYRISETRVDNSTGPFALNLQLRGEVNGLRVHPKENGVAAWQFQPFGDVRGRYLLRLDQTGVKAQLSSCYDAVEPASGKTIACMRDSSTDASQLWDISDFGSGTYKFVNVANGTGYVLDVHPKANLFMSSDVEGTDGIENQVAQHWVLSSVSAVNDGAYSTIYSGNVAVSTNSAALSHTATTRSTTTTSSTARSTQTTSATGSASPTQAMSTSTSTSSPSKGVSTAAGAGIGVAVALSVVGLIGAVAFFWWRRSQRSSKPKYSEVEAKNGDHPDRGSSMGNSQLGESAPSSLHGVSPTVAASNLSAWQPASSVTIPPASSFINGQQAAPTNGSQTGYYAGGQQAMGAQQAGYYDPQQQAAGGQRAGYYVDSQQASSVSGQDEAPIASLYGQRLPPATSQSSGASIYGRRSAPTAGSASIYVQSNGPSSSALSSTTAVPRHQFDHPTAPSEFAPAANTSRTQSVSRSVCEANENQTSSTVTIADLEPMPQAHELEAAERDIVRRQHELGAFHHGPDNFMNEQSSRTQAATAAPNAELSAYQHGPDTFSRNEAKMLGVPKAELGAYQHGPDTFENEHEAKVLGAYHPGTESFSREREDKVLGNFHDIMNMAKPTGRGGAWPQAYEMSPIRTPREHGDTGR